MYSENVRGERVGNAGVEETKLRWKKELNVWSSELKNLFQLHPTRLPV